MSLWAPRLAVSRQVCHFQARGLTTWPLQAAQAPTWARQRTAAAAAASAAAVGVCAAMVSTPTTAAPITANRPLAANHRVVLTQWPALEDPENGITTIDSIFVRATQSENTEVGCTELYGFAHRSTPKLLATMRWNSRSTTSKRNFFPMRQLPRLLLAFASAQSAMGCPR